MKANEATYPPAKDYRVFLNLYLKSLLLYFFLKRKKTWIYYKKKKKNGPVNPRPLL